MKTYCLLLSFAIFSYTGITFAQSSSFDDELQSLTNDLSAKMTSLKDQKIAVWDLQDLDGNISSIGKYIAEDISIDLSTKFHVVNRNQLNTILKENKLKSEGFVDQTTMQQLKKLGAIDILVTGTITVLSNNIKITLQALDDLANIVGATKGNLPTNDDIKELLGVPSNSNRGFNHPVNSNEDYNNSQTVSRDCEKTFSGDYCFYNASSYDLSIHVSYGYIPGNWTYPNQTIGSSVFTLKPKESKCVYGVLAKGSVTKNHFQAYKLITQTSVIGRTDYTTEDDLEDQGDFIVEQCKSKTYSIR